MHFLQADRELRSNSKNITIPEERILSLIGKWFVEIKDKKKAVSA
jgi:hypothetical protein